MLDARLSYPPEDSEEAAAGDNAYAERDLRQEERPEQKGKQRQDDENQEDETQVRGRIKGLEARAGHRRRLELREVRGRPRFAPTEGVEARGSRVAPQLRQRPSSFTPLPQRGQEAIYCTFAQYRAKMDGTVICQPAWLS